MHFTLVTPISCVSRLAPATPDLFGGDRIDHNRLLHQAIEEHPSRARCSSVEPERKLVQVIVQVRRPDGALMSTQQPALQEGNHPVYPREQVSAHGCEPCADSRLNSLSSLLQAPVSHGRRLLLSCRHAIARSFTCRKSSYEGSIPRPRIPWADACASPRSHPWPYRTSGSLRQIPTQ